MLLRVEAAFLALPGEGSTWKSKVARAISESILLAAFERP